MPPVFHFEDDKMKGGLERLLLIMRAARAGKESK